ncbi:MAG: hypothetical protein WBC45_05765 [Atribacterota bacterium]
MKIECPLCGLENEEGSKFCKNCNVPLFKSEIDNRQKDTEFQKNVDWTEKCPLCKTGKLWHIKKKVFLSLSNIDALKCLNCEAIFVKVGEKYKLFEAKDHYNTVWQEYKNKELKVTEWSRIADGGISDDVQRKEDKEYWLTQLKIGNVPISIQQEESTIILKNKEKLYVALSNISLSEPRAVRTGGYGGPSVRLAKGLSFRLGGFKAESHEELRNIDQGTFTLTDKRIVFSGNKKTINVSLNKVISINPYSDGISITREGFSKTQYFGGLPKANISFNVKDKTYVEQFSGLILMYLIEGLARKIETD